MKYYNGVYYCNDFLMCTYQQLVMGVGKRVASIISDQVPPGGNVKLMRII